MRAATLCHPCPCSSMSSNRKRQDTPGACESSELPLRFGRAVPLGQFVQEILHDRRLPMPGSPTRTSAGRVLGRVRNRGQLETLLARPTLGRVPTRNVVATRSAGRLLGALTHCARWAGRADPFRACQESDIVAPWNLGIDPRRRTTFLHGGAIQRDRRSGAQTMHAGPFGQHAPIEKHRRRRHRSAVPSRRHVADAADPKPELVLSVSGLFV